MFLGNYYRTSEAFSFRRSNAHGETTQDELPEELALGKGGGQRQGEVAPGGTTGLQGSSPSLIGTVAKQSSGGAGGFGAVPMRRNGVSRVVDHQCGPAVASNSAEEVAAARTAKVSGTANNQKSPPAEALGLVGPVELTPMDDWNGSIYPTSGIDSPTINDCLFGRGSGTTSHIVSYPTFDPFLAVTHPSFNLPANFVPVSGEQTLPFPCPDMQASVQRSRQAQQANHRDGYRPPLARPEPSRPLLGQGPSHGPLEGGGRREGPGQDISGPAGAYEVRPRW